VVLPSFDGLFELEVEDLGVINSVASLQGSQPDDLVNYVQFILGNVRVLVLFD